METTYTVSNAETEGTTMELNPDPTNKSKPSAGTCCKTKFLFTATCLLTMFIIAGFGYIFGPLIFQFQRKLEVYHFNSSQVTVQHYRLRLDPDIKSNMFHGRASLVFNNSRRSNDLRLTINNLTIEQVNITRRHRISTNGTDYHIWDVTSINVKEITAANQTNLPRSKSHYSEVLIILEEPLETGDYLFDIYYSGSIEGLGLERIEYVDGDNHNIKKRKTLLVLKDASRVFPHFDNNQKIQFELSVSRTTDVSCFSNVLLKETEIIRNKNGYVWDHFRRTPPIHPSSLALVVADYKTVRINQESDGRSSVLKILAPSSYLPRLTYVSDVFPTIFDYFQKYFTNKYPLAKLDLVIVDNEPVMSKLGLILMDSKQLFLNVANGLENLGKRRNIFAAISKGVAEQWLNVNSNRNRKEHKKIISGLAEFLGFSATKALNEDRKDIQGEMWQTEEHFVSDVLGKSLDSLEMGQGGDDFAGSSGKIACVLRMINYTLTEKVFQSGLNRYLSTEEEVFWQSAGSLRLFGNFTLKELLLSWWANEAYPVVTVTRTSGWNMLIEQQSIIPKYSDDVFVVPVSHISQLNDTVRFFTLKYRQLETNLFVPRDQWILLNYNRIGFYRVNYELGNWFQLIQQLEIRPAAIPPINRAQLINDAFALADSNLLQYEVPFRLIKYLRSGNDNETNYLVWKAAIEALNRHEAVFLESSKYGLFRKFKVNMLIPLWNIRKSLDNNLSSLIEEELCRLQYKACISAALELYEKLKHRKDAFIPEWVYCTILTHTDNEYEHLYKKLQASTNPSEVRVLLQSLTCTKEDWDIQSLLEYSLSTKHHAKYIWRGLSRTAMGHLRGLTFLEANWPKWAQLSDENIEKNVEVIKIVIDEYLATLSRATDLYRMHALYIHSPPALENNFDRAMACVGRRIKWFKNHFETYLLYLSGN